MGFREAILKLIEDQVRKLIIPQPVMVCQNDIDGYQNLYQLKFSGPDASGPITKSSDHISIDSSGRVDQSSKMNSYLAPRIPNAGYSTPLRYLHCRPIQNWDVTGLRPGGARARGPDIRPISGAPTAFLHIITGEKDIYWPQRNNPAEGRLGDQIEYLKIAIYCVLRNEAEYEKASNTIGNGQLWNNQVNSGVSPSALPEIDLIDTSQSIRTLFHPTRKYETFYHKTINQQAVGFVEDLESLLVVGPFRNQVYSYGLNHEKQARVMNTLLPIWGMLPDAGNSPTDTVRCVFELEIHYPKSGS